MRKNGTFRYLVSVLRVNLEFCRKKIKLVSVKSPQEIEEINRNKFFRVFLPITLFLEFFKKFFWPHLVPGTSSYTTWKLIFSIKLLFFLFIHREYILN
jgi:hypothetical protein